MPSPFPGMDPYIEASGRWGDFHGALNAAVRAELNARLPEGYAASFDLHVWFHEPEADERARLVKPDVYVAEEGRRNKGQGAGGVAVAPSGRVTLPAVERKARKYIQVEDLEWNRVVTVIEVLSPANKEAGDDREAYLSKRSEYFVNRLNVIELDLLRGGGRLPLGSPAPALSDYYAMVSRAWEWPRADYWTFGIRDPMPEIPVPLSRKVPAVLLPLRPCVDRAYDEGRYATRLRYSQPLTPRLAKQDAAWVKNLLAHRSDKTR